MNWYLLAVIIFLITIVYFGIWIIYVQRGNSRKNKEILSKMIGKTGLALRDVKLTPKSNAVKIGNSLWKAKTDGTEVIKKGSRIQVIKVENDILIVKANIVTQFDKKTELGASQI